MAGMAETQRKTFHKRIKRIHKGGPNTMGHILVGSQDGSTGKARKPIKIRKGDGFFRRLWGAIVDLFLLPISFVTGAAAMVAGIVGVYQLRAMGYFPEAETQLLSYADVLLAVILAFLVAKIFRLSRGIRKVALVLGLLAVFFGQDAIILTYPDMAAELLSEDRVLQSRPVVLPATSAI